MLTQWLADEQCWHYTHSNAEHSTALTLSLGVDLSASWPPACPCVFCRCLYIAYVCFPVFEGCALCLLAYVTGFVCRYMCMCSCCASVNSFWRVARSMTSVQASQSTAVVRPKPRTSRNNTHIGQANPNTAMQKQRQHFEMERAQTFACLQPASTLRGNSTQNPSAVMLLVQHQLSLIIGVSRATSHNPSDKYTLLVHDRHSQPPSTQPC